MRCLDSGAMTKTDNLKRKDATMLFGVLVAFFYLQHTHLSERGY
jgi:hypothetical protein